MYMRSEREKSCDLKLVEITELSQRQIHSASRTEVSKEAVWSITASDCYGDFNKGVVQQLYQS